MNRLSDALLLVGANKFIREQLRSRTGMTGVVRLRRRGPGHVRRERRGQRPGGPRRSAGSSEGETSRRCPGRRPAVPLVLTGAASSAMNDSGSLGRPARTRFPSRPTQWRDPGSRRRARPTRPTNTSSSTKHRDSRRERRSVLLGCSGRARHLARIGACLPNDWGGALGAAVASHTGVATPPTRNASEPETTGDVRKEVGSVTARLHSVRRAGLWSVFTAVCRGLAFEVSDGGYQ
ncbi:hypothetical protein CLV71_114163 [Actinophytocola oryzae]|uniref:Uncharacterized protein n=1 Tax=Actinophytocola oryzae TaxID=502181 RepID=A0A4R7V4C4_9PSEU|nr:hypothetical protein CLV71_114163 [Actinophytocola oryzae]